MENVMHELQKQILYNNLKFTNMPTLTKKVALVTGASRGIGAAIARHLADAGANLIVNYTGSKEPAEELATEIKNSGGTAIAVQAEVSKAEDVKRMFDTGINYFGQIDILVNNAGIMITKLLKDTTDEDFTRQFDVNVR